MARGVTQTRLEITAEQADQILEELNEVKDQVSSLIAAVKRIKAAGKKSPTTSPQKGKGKGICASPVKAAKKKRPRKPQGNYEWSEMYQVWYDPKKSSPRC